MKDDWIEELRQIIINLPQNGEKPTHKGYKYVTVHSLLENFIDSLLKQQQQEYVEKIDGLKIKGATGDAARFNYHPEYYIAFNEALDKAISIIKGE